MLKPKKKFTKKELKQDKFVLITLQTKDFLEKNSRTVLLAVIGVLVLIVAFNFWRQSRATANLEASNMLVRAQDVFYRGQKDAAKDSLKLLIERYDGTASAGHATFLLGKIYWEDDDYDSAKIYLKKFIDDYLDDTIISQSALASYADCLLIEKNYEDAAKYYEKAAKIDPKFPETASYLYSAASAYKEAGEYKKAEKLIDKLLADFKLTPQKNKAELLLEVIKMEQSLKENNPA